MCKIDSWWLCYFFFFKGYKPRTCWLYPNPQFTGRKRHVCKEVTQRSHSEPNGAKMGMTATCPLPSPSPQAQCPAHPTPVLSDSRQGSRQQARGRDFLSRLKGQPTPEQPVRHQPVNKAVKTSRNHKAQQLYCRRRNFLSGRHEWKARRIQVTIKKAPKR